MNSSGTREAVPPRVAVVVGAGAVGSFLGGTLAAAGWDVTLLGRRGGGDGTASPLVIAGPGKRRTTAPVRRVSSPEAAPPHPDLVILAVKMFDLAGALDVAARWPDVPLMTAQNGIGAEASASEARGSALIAASLTTAVEPTVDGVARRRTGGIGLAPVRGDTSALRHELADAFADGGLPNVACDDAAAMKWSKLLANLVGNATSGVLDMDVGAVWGDAAGFEIERRQLGEALAVMRAQGLRVVSLPGGQVRALLLGLRFPGPIARPVLALALGRARGGKSPSLRIRLRGGGTGPTEVRWLNGAVAEAGARLGVPAPVNTTLARLVEQVAADPGSGDAWRANPAALLAECDRASAGG
ncbi:MAG TPA: ketopantoate reductase C-terminal domain-containing protein, partial [Candidatus Limnocylindrales bacterium]